MRVRIGFGFDVHPLESGRPFCLGGIIIPHDKGPAGHSDADVLIHAICDALLGAAGLRDIGFYFPNTSETYSGMDSKILLQEVIEMIGQKGYKAGNLDATVVLEMPRVNPYIDQIKSVLASLMNLSADDIGIKATTNERLGYIGREEGICAYAVVTLQPV